MTSDNRKFHAISHENHAINPNVFQHDLLQWYDINKRDLPWRAHKTPDPYHIWLSEIMLQQTTVKAVIPYFEKFLRLWPTISELAAASEEEVLQHWAGLGYYSRARSLHATANTITQDNNGMFPDSAPELLKLKGIGPYTAAAISTIAFQVPATVIDGNIERILSRITCFPLSPKDNKKPFEQICKKYSPDHTSKRPRDYAQALMDIGATICTPKNPKCHSCPLKKQCQSFAKDTQIQYPVPPAKRTKPIPHYAIANIIYSPSTHSIAFEKRPDNGILASTIGIPTSPWFKEMDQLNQYSADDTSQNSIIIGEIKHIFTHIKLNIHIRITPTSQRLTSNSQFWKNISEIKPTDHPKLFQKILESALEYISSKKTTLTPTKLDL